MNIQQPKTSKNREPDPLCLIVKKGISGFQRRKQVFKLQNLQLEVSELESRSLKNDLTFETCSVKV